MNRNKLHFGFKQQFSVSIHEYQTEQRMQAAPTLLQTTDLPIAQVAERSEYRADEFLCRLQTHFDSLPREVRAQAAPVGG